MRFQSMVVLWLSCGVWLSACGVQPRLAVPAELAAAGDRYPLPRRVGLFRRTLRFGPYVARGARVGVHRATEHDSSRWMRREERREGIQEGQFALSTPSGVVLRVRCRRDRLLITTLDRGWDVSFRRGAQQVRGDDQVTGEEHADSYRCVITHPTLGNLQVGLDLLRGGEGSAVGAGIRAAVVPTRELAEGHPAVASAGYLVVRDGRVDALADPNFHPSMVIRRDLPEVERDLLASVALALVLSARFQ